MKRIILFSVFISLFLTSCTSSKFSAGFKQNYDIKSLNDQMSVVIESIARHDNEIRSLNKREEAILDDMGINLEMMEAEYAKKVEIITEVKQVILAYDLLEPTLSDEDKIVVKGLMYDKIKGIVYGEKND